MIHSIKHTISQYRTLSIATGFCILICLTFQVAKAQNPSASFTSNVFSGCSPLSVDFTNLSSNANDYFWDFGNGNVSTLANPTSVYITPGFYTVTLVAIDTLSGLHDTLVATNYIHVVNDPVADFTASPLVACLGNHNISFTNLSSGATNYIWDFGDGNFSTLSNPTHIYLSPGTFTVQLIARNGFGCNDIKSVPAVITIVPNPPAAFTVNQQSTCDQNHIFDFTCTTPGAISWEWNFGDGNTSTLQNPSHVYGVQGNFNITLIVNNANGCTDTLVEPGYINIGNSLVPSFTSNSNSGCAPFTVDFQCTVANATSWLWDFGDGSTSTSENPSHTYNSPGTYDITLSVTTVSGCDGSVTLPGYIVVDVLPVPSFTVSASLGCSPLQVTFTNTSTGAASYLWDFGNGFTSTDQDPVYVYPDTGTYTVTLTAYSPNGCPATVTVPAAVTVESMSVNFTAINRTGCAPLTVDFTGTSTPAAISWVWDFGDGGTGTGQNPSHTYTAIGNYDISVVATSSAGCVDTFRRVNYVRVVDDSTAYTVPDTIKVCLPPGSVAFSDPTTGSNAWLWDFGDGTTSTVKNPSHTYIAAGIYTVTLNTSMAGGCTQTFDPFAIVQVIPFNPLPIISIVATPCAPFTVSFDNLTLGVASYLWNFGDGSTSTLQNPVHIYAQPGTYTVSLVLTSIQGCSVTLTTSITFGYVDPISVSDNNACMGDTIYFTLDPIAAFATASWNFGDGITSSQLQPYHIYTSPGLYSITVTVTDTSGCVYTFTYPTQIRMSNPIPGFTMNQSATGCVPFAVLFSNTSTGAQSYLWDFGDGGTSTSTNPSHTYATPGVYDVSLIATSFGCSRTITLDDYITANGAQANFSFTPDSGCLPVAVTFTDLSTNAVSWSWDFGDGTTSAQQNPVHIYNAAPTGPVSLIVTDNNGCTDSISMTNVVVVIPDIAVSDTVACRSESLQFTTTLTAVSYLWDFGDGTTSSQQNPTHAYGQAGTFTVSLTCVLASGCTTITTLPGLIDVIAPVADFFSANVAVCAPTLVNFTNQSTGAVSYFWDFGDGTNSVNIDASHIYNIPGTYTITLVAYTADGCADTMVKPAYITVPGTLTLFDVSDTAICQGSSVQFTDLSLNASDWFWNLGDGFTSTLQNPLHVYADTGSFTVTLITTDSVGCSSFYAYPIVVSVYPMPVADATAAPTLGCVPLDVIFTNLSTGNNSYTWDFGDGSASTAANPNYIYNVPGTYFPSLIATNSNGCSDTMLFATPIIAADNPIASFTTSDTSGCAPFDISFTNTSQNSVGANYSWDFGNGITSALQDPTTSYLIPGVFQVSLIVGYPGGCSDTAYQTITIAPSPVAQFTMSDTLGCGPMTVSFNHTGSGSTTWLWDFGDGTTSSIENPSHTYNTPGIYFPSLIASNSSGCSDTILSATAITVGINPTASFNASVSSGCVPLDISFTNTSLNSAGANYSWDFGNGVTSSIQDPTISYNNPGVFQVSLIVSNPNGCTDTAIQTITILPAPVAQFTVSDSAGCGPLTVTFNHTGSGSTSWLWDFGDGASSSVENPTHIYNVPGTYDVTLIVANPGGCTDTIIMNNLVDIFMTPVSNFTRSPQTGCLPLDVVFVSSSTQLVNPTYLWDFGNGQSGSNPVDTITYLASGVFSISLVVINSNGCTDTTVKNVQANLTPQALALVNISSGCTPFSAQFTNNSVNANSVLWNFGDGTTSTAQNPVHPYVPGVYQPFLVANGTAGCRDTFFFSLPIDVHQSPNASISITGTNTCTPAQFIFGDQSTQLSNPAYSWTISNGQTGTGNSLSGNFITAGIYMATLIVTNDSVCSDTATTIVQVYDSPVISAATNDTLGCAPYPVQFTNNTVNGNTWLWDFGDGNTSTLLSPSHVYTAPGNYSVTLIAEGLGGCTDTLVMPQLVTVNAAPVASIANSSGNSCAPLNVLFGNNSTGLSTPTYLWEFGNGVTSNAFSPSYTYTISGTFPVTLTVTNAGGCSSTDSIAFVVNTSPTAAAAPYPASGCEPFTVNFNSLSSNADSVIWFTGDGSQVQSVSYQHTYQQTGVFNPYLVAYNSSGCTDTLFLAPVTVSPQAVAGFSVDATSGCPGISFQFTNSSLPAIGLQYQWNIGGYTTTVQNPLVVLNSPGFIDVQLIVTAGGGCSDTLEIPQYIQVFDSVAPPASPILSVTVLDNSSVKITWQNSASLDLAAYVLYRFNTVTAQFQEIYRDTTPANSSMVVISEYTDTGLNTLLNTYTYKLSTLDICTHTLPLSSLSAHTTINITAIPVSGNIQVNWNSYGGCPVASYELRREDVATGTTSLIATLPANVLAYQDTGFACPELYAYRVTATALCGTTYSSQSDTAAAQPPNLLAGQKCDIVRSTVIDDRDVLTEWLPPTVLPQRVVEYVILRSDDGNTYTEIARVPASTNSFIDYNALVHQQDYHYRIDVINDCQVAGAQGIKGRSIFLQSNYPDDKTRLWWTPYEQWIQGVDHYTIELLNSNGQWDPIKTVNGNMLEVIIDE